MTNRSFSAIILFALLIFSVTPLVGANSTMWSQTYGGSGHNDSNSLVETSDGGYAIAGYTDSFGAGNNDFWLVKTDATGTQEWNQTYGGTGNDYAYSVVETSDGGYAIAGYTDSFGAGNNDFWLVKTDATGTQEWNQTYGGTGYDVCFSLIQTSDNGFALAGYTDSVSTGGYDFWMVKTDEYGNADWSNAYGELGDDIAYSLIETSDGGYALAGYTDFLTAGNDDFCLIKVTSTGTLAWNKAYGGTENERASSIIELSTGEFVLAGYTNSFGAGNNDYWLIKTTAIGTLEWNQTYGGPNVEYANQLLATPDGGYALAGTTNSFGAGEYDFWLVKTDTNGNLAWDQTYGGTGYDVANSLVETSDGGYSLTGPTRSFGSGLSSFWLVKTDENGIIPEFPSWTILPLLLFATATAIIYTKRLHKPNQQS